MQGRKCKYQVSDDKLEDALLIDVFQYSYTHGDSPLIGGYKAGQVSYPVAVILHNGLLKEVLIKFIKEVE